ncbi:N-acetyltransferase [Leucobacter tenebrionis]|nr:N-acetyltransferase [Leucobacter tenebrionis]
MEKQTERGRYVLIDKRPEANAAADAPGPVEIGEEAYVDVTDDEGRIERVFYHTGVSKDYAGQGLASTLVRTAVDDAIVDGARIVPVCPYVKSWLRKHPDYAEHLVEPREDHIRAITSS